MSRFLRGLACTVSLLLPLLAGAAPDDIQDARRLMSQGNMAGAMERVDAILSRQPKDARARFLKGVILVEQGKQPEAIKIFTALTEDFPELPEPYNNLAVLYAAQGQDEKARRALEMAIRTHPSYATAHENLGDIYAKMAREAYDKALQLDSNNASARAKLALVKELFSQRPPGAPPLVKSTVGEPVVPSVAVPTAPAGGTSPATPAAAPPPVAVAPPKPVVSATDAPAAKADAGGGNAKEGTDAASEVLKAVQAWAKAWSAGDAKTYLAFYAPGFRPPGGQGRNEWEQSRRERLAKSRKISVQVQNPKVTFARPEEAVVTFRQSYRSDALKTSGLKRLTLTRVNGRWLIQQEEVVR